VYETVRSRTMKCINRQSLVGHAHINHSNIFTMFLRLRQLTGHMLMVEASLKGPLEREDVEKLVEIANQEALDVMKPVKRGRMEACRSVSVDADVLGLDVWKYGMETRRRTRVCMRGYPDMGVEVEVSRHRRV
jgi:hypothetical protein